MKIAIAGFGKEGQAALKHWQSPDNQITICDSNTELTIPNGFKTQLGPDYLKGLDSFDLIVRTPGLHPNEIIKANSTAITAKITTGTSEFFKNCPTKNIIGITGTKGKGTTSSLVAKLLEASGKTVHLGGNIGIAPLDMLTGGIEPTDWVVLELSNFQLIDLRYSPAIAACVMIVPEHLDWHASMQEYLDAKQNIFAHQTAQDLAVFDRANVESSKLATASPAQKISYQVPPTGQSPEKTGAHVDGDNIYMNQTLVCKVADVQLLGRHNLENICAAIATTWELVGQNPELIQKVVQDFKGLPHRLEFVAQKQGLRFYDDSFASTPDAAIAAMNAVPGAKVIILGGFDRGLPLEGLSQAAQQADIRKAIIIGAGGERLARALTTAGFTNYQVLTNLTMPQILEAAIKHAQPDDAVVLSPGFPSFDMFKNFEDRGQQFNAAVQSL